MPTKTAEKPPVKASIADAHHAHHEKIMEYAMNAKWYSWESPIGLSIFFLSLCLCLVALSYVLVLLKTAGIF